MQPIECIINFYFDDNVNAQLSIPIQFDAIKPNLTSHSHTETNLTFLLVRCTLATGCECVAIILDCTTRRNGENWNRRNYAWLFIRACVFSDRICYTICIIFKHIYKKVTHKGFLIS